MLERELVDCLSREMDAVYYATVGVDSWRLTVELLRRLELPASGESRSVWGNLRLVDAACWLVEYEAWSLMIGLHSLPWSWWLHRGEPASLDDAFSWLVERARLLWHGLGLPRGWCFERDDASCRRLFALVYIWIYNINLNIFDR